jgi:hypothetical protein
MPLEIGQKYKRAEVFDILGLPKEERRGDWFTGYKRYNGQIFVFCNVGAPGRTGHRYKNRWDGPRLVWYAIKRSKVGQPLIDDMVGGQIPVHVFWRDADRSPFTYEGIGTPYHVEPQSPVQITWHFAAETIGPSTGAIAEIVSESSLDQLFAQMAVAIAQRIKASGQQRVGVKPRREGPGQEEIENILHTRWREQEGRCSLCGEPMPLNPTNRLFRMSPDRIDSASKTYDATNLQLSHLGCNLAKNDTTMKEWQEFLLMLRYPACLSGAD